MILLLKKRKPGLWTSPWRIDATACSESGTPVNRPFYVQYHAITKKLHITMQCVDIKVISSVQICKIATDLRDSLHPNSTVAIRWKEGEQLLEQHITLCADVEVENAAFFVEVRNPVPC